MKRQLFVLLLILIFSTLIYAEWSDDPTINNAICDLNGEQAIPKVVTSVTGDTYIGYFSNDSGNYDVRLQRLDSQGNEMWDHNGILVSDNPAMTWLTDWDMTVDDDNNAILVFQDIRNGGNNNIYVYKILSDGTFIWGNDGIELSNSTAFDVAPKVCVTSESGTVITWQSDDAIIMQRIANNGTLVWGPTGITLSCADTYSWPQPFAVENDHILLKFFHDSGPAWAPTRHCYIQKFDNDGNTAWANDTVVSNADGITAWTQVFNIISDGNNGCFISWHDSRGGGTISYPFVQHINSDGTVAFTANGVQLTTEMDRQSFYPESVYFEETNELITYWGQTDGNQNNHGITGQKIDVSGSLLWGDNGNNLISVSSDYIQMVGLRKASDNLMLFLEDYTNAVDAHVIAAKIDQDGNYVWTEEQITMCSVESDKVHNVVNQLSNGQFVASWEDGRNGGKDIYAQNINLDGTLGVSILNGTIEGNVTLNGGSGNVEEVEVTAGSVTVNPDTSGNYSISIFEGTYNVTASLEYYYGSQISPSIVVIAGNIVSGGDFILNWIQVLNPPLNLVVDPNTGYVSWDPPEPYPGAELEGYNLYRDGVFLEFGNGTNFTLNGLVNGETYTIAISTVYIQGESDIVETEFSYLGTSVSDNLIIQSELIGNIPNPFNPVTTISYSIKETNNVIIEVYNLKGQLVKILVNEVKKFGEHSVVWNGSDSSNKSVSSGVYLYKMKTKNHSSIKKMILMK